MLTDECWFGYHGRCGQADTCDCLCHMEFDWMEEP